jgi:hypothetical protein
VRALATVVLLAAGCGTDASARGDVVEPPLTHDDPPSYVPPPSDAPETGDAVGVAATGGYDQAKAIAVRLVRAVRDADEQTLTQLLAAHVANLFPRLGHAGREREAVVARIMTNHAQSGLGTEVPIHHLIDEERFEVTPLSRVYAGQALPPGMQGTDLQVTFPVQAEGRRVLTILVGWPTTQGGIIVRPGTEPRIVAL